MNDELCKFTAGSAFEQFYLFRFGLYRFKIMDVPYYPTLAETRISLSHNYLISALSALIGALLMMSHSSSTGLARIMRVLTGVATGLLLTFGSFYGQLVTVSFFW